MAEPEFQVVSEPKSKKRKRKSRIAINAVIDGIVVVSLVYILLAYGPFLFQELRYYTMNLFGKSYAISEDIDSAGPKPAGSVVGSIIQGTPSIGIEPKDKDFGIIIEKLGVNEVVVPDVDPEDKDSYRRALKVGVAHAEGTKYPGETGNVYLFSHSTANVWDIVRYKSYFTLLRKLEPGDRVILFYEGNRYDYEVYETKVIDPEDTSDLTGYSEFPIVTLQTCEPPGSDAQRLVVKAKLSAYELSD